jgi:hypothetical protein
MLRKASRNGFSEWLLILRHPEAALWLTEDATYTLGERTPLHSVTKLLLAFSIEQAGTTQRFNDTACLLHLLRRCSRIEEIQMRTVRAGEWPLALFTFEKLSLYEISDPYLPVLGVVERIYLESLPLDNVWKLLSAIPYLKRITLRNCLGASLQKHAPERDLAFLGRLSMSESLEHLTLIEDDPSTLQRYPHQNLEDFLDWLLSPSRKGRESHYRSRLGDWQLRRRALASQEYCFSEAIAAAKPDARVTNLLYSNASTQDFGMEIDFNETEYKLQGIKLSLAFPLTWRDRICNHLRLSYESTESVESRIPITEI